MPPPRKPRPPETLPVADPLAAVEVPITREELVVATDPHGQLAEQFRRLRSAIETLNPDGAPRTLMVTSAIEGEGKSVATLNLALALVERSGLAVLVLDADLRRPSIEGYLGLDRCQGVAEVLRGELPIDRAIRRTSVRGLEVLGAGHVGGDPAAFVQKDRLRTLLHALKQRYDYVLVDAAPALMLVDPTLVGSNVDGILLCVRLGKTPRQLVEEAQNTLEASGGNLLGVCLLGAHSELREYSVEKG